MILDVVFCDLLMMCRQYTAFSWYYMLHLLLKMIGTVQRWLATLEVKITQEYLMHQFFAVTIIIIYFTDLICFGSLTLNKAQDYIQQRWITMICIPKFWISRQYICLQ